MALVKCPECGNEISDKAEICPKCGYRQRNKSMMKIVGGCIFVIFAFLSLVCHNISFLFLGAVLSFPISFLLQTKKGE